MFLNGFELLGEGTLSVDTLPGINDNYFVLVKVAGGAELLYVRFTVVEVTELPE